VCDGHSEDKTVVIAKECGAVIVEDKRFGYPEPARHRAISKASCEWVLVIDADEVLTEKLALKIQEIIEEGKIDVVYVGILYNYFGKCIRHGGFFNNRNFPRVFRKKIYMETYDKRDEFVHHGFTNIKEKAKNSVRLPLEYFIEHYPYPDIKSYVDKTIGRYALIEAQNMRDLGQGFRLSMMILEPIKVFLAAYIIRRGFLDGMEGFILAALYSVYRFCVWANLWFFMKGKTVSAEQG
jgi:glycosyltransferase involved in cell wall biosynthesis